MIKLTRSETDADAAVINRHQWPVAYTAVFTADNSPARIFVMQASPDPDVFADSLSCIANAIQMTDLPEDAVATGSPFYRIASVTKLCRSALAATEFIEKVEDAVQDLVDNLTSAATLSVASEVTITPSA